LLRLIRFDDRIDAITANYFRYLLPWSGRSFSSWFL
jgi:hypothetical protein